MRHAIQNWKTSAAGVLIAIVAVCGALATQGVSLGHAGTGTVVSLITAIASAVLGVLARDPGQPSDLASNPKQDATQ